MELFTQTCFGIALTSSLVLSPMASALNIVLTNDDSWNTTNIISLKSALEAAGHDVDYVRALHWSKW